MGRANALAAYTLHPGLNHRAHRALTYMALVSLDPPGTITSAACTYWGGHEGLAEALGLVEAGAVPTRAHLEVVRRVMKELMAAGAVTTISSGHRNRRAVYRLHLEALPPRHGGAADPTPRRGISAVTAGQHPAATAGPRTKEDNYFQYPGRTLTSSTQVQTAHAHEEQDDDPELTAARHALAILGPAAQQAALQAAADELGADADTQDLITTAGLKVTA